MTNNYLTTNNNLLWREKTIHKKATLNLSVLVAGRLNTTFVIRLRQIAGVPIYEED